MKAVAKSHFQDAILCWGDTSEFPIPVGLYQGSALSLSPVALVMDELTRSI